MQITLKKNWFNPLFFILNEIIKDDTIRSVLIYGGKGSAKTASVCQIVVKEALINVSSTIGFRKESAKIPDTLRESFKLGLETTRLYPAFQLQDRRVLCDNGAKIVMRGLDSEGKAKGIESFLYVIADELDQFLPLEWEQMDLSLRGRRGQKLFGLWNPVDENSWVKTDLIDPVEWVDSDRWKLPHNESFVRLSKDGSTILIKTTYEDNYWIAGSPCGDYGFRDEGIIAKYNRLKTTNYNSYKVNVLGEWGKTNFGGEILKNWDSSHHTGKHEYNPRQAVYLSFDENVNPYFPCGFFQVGEGDTNPRMIHAIAAKNPNNTTKWMGREIIRVLRQWRHKEHLYIGGDATSKKDDVKLEKGHNLFKIMEKELWEFRPQIKMPRSNPSVRTSTDFFNAILIGEVEYMTFGVDSTCKIAIQDFENTKEDKNGHVDKSVVRDPVTKVSYQPFGHFFDVTRYFLTHVYSKEYNEYQRGDTPAVMATGNNNFNSSKRY